MRTRWWMAGVALVIAGAAAPTLSAQVPTEPAAAATAEDSAGLLQVAAAHARAAAAKLHGTASRGAGAARAAAAYRAGLASLGQGHLDSAIASFRAAVAADSTVALYHGDLGFALAIDSQWAGADEEYHTAVRLQGRNPWYYVGLGAVQVGEQHWAQAAASFTLAVSTDSAVIVRQLVDPAGEAFTQARMTSASEAWSHMATERFPDEPMPWLRLASAAYMRHDTAAGFPAIRRFRTLRPDDAVGAMLYAEYMLTAGQYDSSFALAMQAANDTALRPLAAQVIYNAGGHLLEHDQFARSAEVLEQGRTIAPAALHPQFDMFIGVARLRVLQDTYNTAVKKRDCRQAQVVDTMLNTVRERITSGMAFDSLDAVKMLDPDSGAVGKYRKAIDNFKRQCNGRD